MNRPHPASPHDRDARVFALCAEQLAREEAVLQVVLLSLRQVRDAFLQRNLDNLPALQSRQEQLARTNTETVAERERLREQLAPLLGIAPARVTLRAAALSLAEPARGQLLRRRDRLLQQIEESKRLTQQNAALLNCGRDFFERLFASLTGANLNERYGPQGERRPAACGSLLVTQG
jgi:hypothetical protein